MDDRQRLVMAVAMWLVLPWHGSAATVIERLTTGTGETVMVFCRTGRPAVDYAAETASGIGFTDLYPIERGALSCSASVYRPGDCDTGLTVGGLWRRGWDSNPR